MRKLLSAKAADAAGKAALLLACLAWSWGDAALATTGTEGVGQPANSHLPIETGPALEDLYLEVYVNDYRTNTLASFRRYDGCLTVTREDFAEYKLKAPESALHASGRVCLERVPGLTYRYDERAQTIHLFVPDDLREILQFDARGPKPDIVSTDPGSHLSAVFNYALTANFGSDDYEKKVIPSYRGVGANLDAHFFSEYGNFDQSGAARSQVNLFEPNLLRLDSRWYYNDAATLRTYAAGDIQSGALPWTRSIRLGGVQFSRDFTLRPDLVTTPVPSFSGSAAVPSTVEVYANQTRTFSQEVTGGPFNISNLPVVSGPGVLKLVIRDASGKETTSEYAYYASSRLLQSGLYDYSAEAGFARTFFGVSSNSYDENPVGSGSARYGLTDRITLEGHGEAGAGLGNVGAGAVWGLWRYGIASAAASVSDYSGKTGGQVTGSIETSVWGARLYARTLRSLGEYEDLASATAPKAKLREFFGPNVAAASGATYRRQDQLSVSVPLTFDAGSLNFSYTDAEDAARNSYKIGSVSYSRPFLWNSNLFVNGYNDFERTNAWGAYAGVTFTWDKYSAGATAQATANSYSAGGNFSRSLGQDAGSYGYNIRAQEGTLPVNSASVAYRAQEVKLEAGVQQVGKSALVTASAEGSVAVMNGVYFANRIDNSFAIVDTGIPGVTVLHDNHPIGETDSAGRILIPNVRAREQNTITIDPATLPVQADLDETKQIVVPKQKGGTSVHFKGNAQPASAVAVFKDETGKALPASSEVWVNGAPDPFVIGYDGEAYLTNLSPSNTALVKRPDGTPCNATFAFAQEQGAQARIDGVICSAAPTASAVASAEPQGGVTIRSKQ